MARADELINRLPHKYDTILSKLFRNGQEISLGQWQRICLARLFMKKSPILIFDEPTAHLDIETEDHLLHEINQVSRNRICILASHRMFQQGVADQIVVLKKGVIQEVGSYEKLMALNGEFARLHELYYNITKEYVTNGHAVSNTTSLKLIQL
jgi:ATP-binding cassette subfamily B protein